MTRVGPSALCVFAKTPRAPAPSAAPAAAPPPSQRPAVPKVLEALDPVEWHRAVLAEMEMGDPSRCLPELVHLVEVFPDYLPGRFEMALAMRRLGRAQDAAAALREMLRRAERLDPDSVLDGPEAISLEFYLTSARSFLESAGGLP